VVSPWRSCTVPGLLLVLAVPAGLGAQSGTVAVDRENFRSGPQGTILAEVAAGTRLALGPARDGWREVTLDGWIWAPSVRSDRRDGHDLVVVADGGENLRGAPAGEVIARLRRGMLLDSLGADGSWIRVRRTAWMWAASMRMDQPAREAPRPAPVTVPVAAVTPEPAAASGREFATAGARGLVVQRRPAGDTVARVPPGASVEVVAREGNWARVRIEGWIPTGALAAATDAATGVLLDISREDLRQGGDLYHGRVVEWSIQFISLQQAERFRTDFAEGEPFILARGPAEDAGFVYLAVPPDRLAEAQRLTPLQRIRVRGRVRSASSPLTDAPVLDLLEIRRDDGRR
jgi:hypothetical protein